VRYELTDHEWAAIEPMPNKPRGVPRENDRRVLNDIFRSCDPGRRGAMCRRASDHIPLATIASFAGVVPASGAGFMDALAAAHDAAVPNNRHIHCARASARRLHYSKSKTVDRPVARWTDQQDSRGGRHQRQDGPALTTGEAHDNRLAAKLLARLTSGSMMLTDRGYNVDWIRTLVDQRRAWANIPPKRNRQEALCFSPYLYRARKSGRTVLQQNQAVSARGNSL
jgi:transposase